MICGKDARISCEMDTALNGHCVVDLMAKYGYTNTACMDICSGASTCLEKPGPGSTRATRKAP